MIIIKPTASLATDRLSLEVVSEAKLQSFNPSEMSPTCVIFNNCPPPQKKRKISISFKQNPKYWIIIIQVFYSNHSLIEGTMRKKATDRVK